MSKKDANEALVSLLASWKFNPRKFAIDGLGYTLSNQQTEFLDLVGDMFRAKYKKSHGEAMSISEVPLADKWGISVSSGHGIGKDFSLAIVLLWLLVVWSAPNHPATGLVTGPNFTTLKSVLWKEFRRHIRQGKLMGAREGWLAQIFEMQSDKVVHKELPGESFIEARSISVSGSQDAQGEALAGRHEQYMILAVDEASGVPDGVFRPIEGAMTGTVNFSILIGNMTRNSGYFFETQNSNKIKKFWACKRFSTEDSNLDTILGTKGLQEQIDKYEQKYGRDTNAFRVRIQGLPPTAEDDVLIPREWVMNAVNRGITAGKNDGLLYGVDVAWAGKDRSVLVKRKGGVVMDLKEIRNLDPDQVALWVKAEYDLDRADGNTPYAVMVDTIGLGAGTYGRLREFGLPNIHAVNVSENANDKEAYGRKRNELWHTLREQFRAGTISIPDNEDLIEQLSGIKVHPPDASGVQHIYSKAEIRKHGGESPDHADALCLTFALGGIVTRGGEFDYFGEIAIPQCSMLVN